MPLAPLPSPASLFGVLGGSTVTNSGPTVVTGNVGVSPGAAITGFPPGTATGAILGPGPVTVSAQNQNVAAYLAAQALPAGIAIAGDQIGVTLNVPGTYTCAAGLSNTGVWTLDGAAGQQYVFQIVSTLIFGTGATLVLTGGLRPEDVYFAVGSSATIGVNAIIQGLILALTSISMNTGATANGVLFAQTGAVTLLSNVVVNPGGGGSTGIGVQTTWPNPAGPNTPTLPSAGAMRINQTMSVIVTGDGGNSAFTVNHNFALSAADLTKGFPEVEAELLGALTVPTVDLVVTSKTANTVVFSCGAFTGASLRVRIQRPWTATR